MDELLTNLLDTIKAKLILAGYDSTTIDYSLRKELGSFNGRFVNVVVLTAAKAGPATRVEDYFDVRIGIITGVRNTDRGTPTREWFEGKIKETLSTIYNLLTSPRVDFFAGFWPQSDEMSVLYSHDLLDQNKTYWGEMEIQFRTILADSLIVSNSGS